MKADRKKSWFFFIRDIIVYPLNVLNSFIFVLSIFETHYSQPWLWNTIASASKNEDYHFQNCNFSKVFRWAISPNS